ncbi:hypothetical protein CCMSSC00406_0006029 [Pleurotus cornucopiae]|uniref:Uncharacterized protein n=1 Tax=Pleurotus cornucopiae TaxID=5321 RepID=A0ACB7IPH1_PLECO|nr:hypothetical protein CCMSSC00406_0006029 [Pleurotus cornucopiae]
MSDSPTRMQFTASPSPAPSDNHDHDHAPEDRAHSLPVELPPSHLPSHVHPTHSQTLPLRLAYPMAANAPQRLVSEPAFPTYYPPLPADHPPLPPHAHADNSKKCPFAAKHEFCPPQEGDVRSPCPALNTMANHGYINRSGKNLTAAALSAALQKCYNLSLPLAIVLSYGGFILLHRYNFLRGIDLKEVGKHGFVEHDASLVHRDTILGDDQHGDVHGSENGRTLADSTIAGSSTAAPSTKPSSRSPINRLTASLSLPALPIPLKKEKKPVYYAPVEIVPQWVDALMEDARMLLQDEEWAFKVMAGDQELERKVEEEAKEKEAKAEGRKLGQIPAPLNLNGTAHAHANSTPTNTPSAPVVEPSPSGEGYDVTIPSTPTEHTLHTHTRDVTSASDATTASSLSSSAHSALGSAFLPMSAGTTSTAQTTPAQTPQSSKFNTVNAHGLGKSLLVNLASLDAQANGGTSVIVDEHEVVASPTTMTASQTLGRTLPPSAPPRTLPNALPALPPSESSSSTHRTLLTSTSISLSRIRREAHSLAHAQAAGGAGRTGKDGKVQGIDAVHAEIARGEMAIVLGMWEVEDYPAVRQRAMTLASGGEDGEGGEEKFPGEGRAVGEDKKENKRNSLFKRFSTSSSFSSIPHSKSFPSSSHPSHPSSNPSTHHSTDPIKGVPAEWFREWITYERLPGGWRPMRTQGLLDTMKRSREVKKGMERFRAEFSERSERERERVDASGGGEEKEDVGGEEKRVAANGDGAAEREERVREEF